MSIVKKQTIALGLLLLTALPLLFAAGVFITQSILQQQRRMRFRTETMVTIQLSASEIIWVKQGKEILHDGKLFDVKSINTSGKLIALTGFYDHKEDKLVKALKEIVEQNEDGNSPVKNFLVKFLFYPKSNDVNIFSIKNYWAIKKHRFRVYSDVITRLVYPAPAPPPKFSLL